MLSLDPSQNDHLRIEANAYIMRIIANEEVGRWIRLHDVYDHMLMHVSLLDRHRNLADELFSKTRWSIKDCLPYHYVSDESAASKLHTRHVSTIIDTLDAIPISRHFSFFIHSNQHHVCFENRADLMMFRLALPPQDAN